MTNIITDIDTKVSSSYILDFKDGHVSHNSIALFANRPSLKLMLWAGDCVHHGIPDVNRLPGYDIYLCSGYQGLTTNIVALFDWTQPVYICLIDIHDINQLNAFTSLFRNRFSVIDSDYHGNTPSLPLTNYSELLMPRAGETGKAYNTEGINSVFFPFEALEQTLELFAPILPEALNNRRLWIPDMRYLAHANELSLPATWSSSEMEIYYPTIKDAQRKFRESQQCKYPQLDIARAYNSDNIEAYWDLLFTPILCVNINRTLSWESSKCESMSHWEWLEPIKKRYATYLKMRTKAWFDTRDILEYQDFLKHIGDSDNSATISDTIIVLQRVLKMQAYCESISATPKLSPSIQYYPDMRRGGIPHYGIVISKM